MRRKIEWLLIAAASVPAAFVLAFATADSMFFPFGPSDRSYVEGFRVGWARDTTARWARARASVRLPIEVSGPAALRFLASRPERPPAEVEVLQGSRRLGLVPVGPRTAPFELPLAPGAARLQFTALLEDPGYGLKLEGLRLVPQHWGALVPLPSTMALAALSATILGVSLLVAGFPGRDAFLLTLATFGMPLAILALLDPFASIHWLRSGALLASAGSLGLALPNRGGSRWDSVVHASCFVAASMALFHPAYHFKDVDIHGEVAHVVEEEGVLELWSRTEFYQQKFGLGRATLGGQRRPMPYPPVLHTIAGLVPGDTEWALKSTGIVFYALTVLVVMTLGRELGLGAITGIAAGILMALFPDFALELLRASYGALLGQLVALTVVFLLFRRWASLRTTKGALFFGALFGAWALVYNAGPLTLAVFLPLVFIAFSLPPGLPGRAGLVAAGGLGALLALVYYGGFVFELLTRSVGDGIPRAMGYRFRASIAGWEAFGPIYIALALAGLAVFLKREGNTPRGRILLAWAAFALAVSIPVFFAPDPLYYFRRLFFVYPLGPILAVFAASRRRSFLAGATALLVLWSAWRMADFIEPFYVTHTGSLARPSS